jgi:tripartite-type tricarboxylate transporter receptor subunit TctC
MKNKVFALLSMVTVLAVMTGCSGSKGTSASAPGFPAKNIKIIVPYDAGGGVDITTRLFADAAGKDYLNGHQIIVENMGGGGAVIGHTNVANSTPDGYTLLAYTNAVVNNPVLKEVTYTHNSFKPLVMVCFDPEILVVPLKAGYKTFEEFLEFAKTNKIKLSTPGHSTSHHLAAINIAKRYGLTFEYLHNGSAAIQKQQLLGGHCDAALMAVGETVSEINDGSIIALAVATKERIPSIQNVPTFIEKGFQYEDGAFRGFAVPAKTPDDVYKVLVSDFEKIAKSEKFIQTMKGANIPYSYKGAGDFQVYADLASESLKSVKDGL